MVKKLSTNAQHIHVQMSEVCRDLKQYLKELSTITLSSVAKEKSMINFFCLFVSGSDQFQHCACAESHTEYYWQKYNKKWFDFKKSLEPFSSVRLMK